MALYFFYTEKSLCSKEDVCMIKANKEDTILRKDFVYEED